MKDIISIDARIGTWKFLVRLILLNIPYGILFIIPQFAGYKPEEIPYYYIFIQLFNAATCTLFFIQRLNDIGWQKYYAILLYLPLPYSYYRQSTPFLISAIIASLVILYVIFAKSETEEY